MPFVFAPQGPPCASSALEGALAMKAARLETSLAASGPAMVAFSGGVDSSLLLYFAAKAHPGRTVALTVRSPFASPADERDRPAVLAGLVALELKFQTREIFFNPLADQAVAANPRERCYLCKKIMAGLWLAEAGQLGLTFVFEGGQQDDEAAPRPGRRALLEAGIQSPLAAAGLTKAEVRELSRRLGLTGHGRPSQACLASRVPYGQPLTEELLARVYETERLLGDRGFPGARARVAGNLLRLEFPPEHFDRLAAENGWPGLFTALRHELAPLGWDFVTVDVNGYQSACFDGPLPETQ